MSLSLSLLNNPITDKTAEMRIHLMNVLFSVMPGFIRSATKKIEPAKIMKTRAFLNRLALSMNIDCPFICTTQYIKFMGAGGIIMEGSPM